MRSLLVYSLAFVEALECVYLELLQVRLTTNNAKQLTMNVKMFNVY
jgi:hypothetical protein